MHSQDESGPVRSQPVHGTLKPVTSHCIGYTVGWNSVLQPFIFCVFDTRWDHIFFIDLNFRPHYCFWGQSVTEMRTRCIFWGCEVYAKGGKEWQPYNFPVLFAYKFWEPKTPGDQRSFSRPLLPFRLHKSRERFWILTPNIVDPHFGTCFVEPICTQIFEVPDIFFNCYNPVLHSPEQQRSKLFTHFLIKLNFFKIIDKRFEVSEAPVCNIYILST